MVQYFTVPLPFLQDSGHSCGFRWIPEEWDRNPPESTGIHRNPQEWDRNPQEWDRNPQEWDWNRSDAFIFGPAPVFVYTQERTTPRPPPSTELLDLDPNSPRARGLCRKYNIKVVSDDSIGDRTGVVAEVVQAIGKVWERAMDPEASSDPSIRNLQAAFDKLLTRGDEFTKMDRMDLVRHSEIHQEVLRSLPDSIATTSHYRYVLATLRREKDRLREQIDSDRDLVAAMDATLEGLRPFIPDEIPDKGKGRDKRDGPGFK
ncbi:uncharacterized protein LACBIDRAFT_333315 [Laccaria bicolor S238N-H82]|uniref:Predicted protein n=1 Tax=Laccaria bicolor (strain S238N-H82 / ATCC MYA-4686) TaxID=486041 RepID=B0DVJ7_LACBS|nr:uncharacterized protein LACBIDRAFT_333315 [Laccaria bicolor S238N-H82]EDR01398.1 predicted protein [Laccaria bicolor S238N-H82]|eukprot:XP_001887943.1 predicted protein [Laccaria bicolor S238N-H82]